jgi:electron transport complex protein RnfA
MEQMLIILLSAILVNNFVLVKFLGICSFLGVSKTLDSSLGMSYAVIFVMVLCTAVTYPIQVYLLDPMGIGYLQTIVFILVIAALVQLVEIAMKKYMQPLYKALGVYLPLITTNCAVLGVAILNINESYTFFQSIMNSLGAGLGYMLAMVLFSKRALSGSRAFASTMPSHPPAASTMLDQPGAPVTISRFRRARISGSSRRFLSASRPPSCAQVGIAASRPVPPAV